MTEPGQLQPRPSLTLLVCRGCCCGTVQKHPDVDHEAQLRSLEAAAANMPATRVLAVGCVEECSHSNVIVVRRRSREKTSSIWLGEMLSDEKTRALAEWMASGDASTMTLPPILASASFVPGNDAVCAVEKIENERDGAP